MGTLYEMSKSCSEKLLVDNVKNGAVSEINRQRAQSALQCGKAMTHEPICGCCYPLRGNEVRTLGCRLLFILCVGLNVNTLFCAQPCVYNFSAHSPPWYFSDVKNQNADNSVTNQSENT